MALLEVLKYGDPFLRKQVVPIDENKIDPELIENMFETMYNEKGIGLAANQVGKSINLFVTDTSDIEEELDNFPQLVFINSEIIHSEGNSVMEEGCLSIPEIRAEISRPEKITLKYQDNNFALKKDIFSGLMSRIIQHEIDHLNGKYFIDYLSPGKRVLLQKRLMEISKTGTPNTGIVL